MKEEYKGAKKSFISTTVFGILAIIIAIVGLCTKNINLVFCIVAMVLVSFVWVVMAVMFYLKHKEYKIFISMQKEIIVENKIEKE